MQGNTVFFKVVIYVKGDHYDYPFQVPINVVTALTIHDLTIYYLTKRHVVS